MTSMIPMAVGLFFLMRIRKAVLAGRRSLDVTSFLAPPTRLDLAVPVQLVFACLAAYVVYLPRLTLVDAMRQSLILAGLGLVLWLAVPRIFAWRRKVYLTQAARSPEYAEADFGFFLCAPDLKTPWHFQMWEDHLHSSGRRVVFITTERRHFEFVRNQGRTPAILTNGATAIETLCTAPSRMSAMFYANNSYMNGWVLRNMSGVQHVQLLHGDSDKPPSYNPVAKMYDKLFVAGRMAIDRYSRHGIAIADDRFEIVGRPQVSAIEQVSADKPRKTIVYMPTWRGFYTDTQFSSLDRGAEMIEAILAMDHSVEILFKPHPMSRKDPLWPQFEAEITAALQKPRTNGNFGKFASDELDPFDAYNAADLMICDISSVMIDYLYSGKTLCVIDPVGFTPEDLAEFASLESAYRIDAQLKNLVEVIRQALENDPLKAKRLTVRDYAFGDLHLPAGEAFRNAIEKLVVAG